MKPKKILLWLLVIAVIIVGWSYSKRSFHTLHHPNKNSNKSSVHSEANTSSLKLLVSIKPLYSLVCGLTKGVPGIQTQLLLQPPHSPHTFHLKPSDVSKIVNADLVIWVGPELENFLINPLNNLKSKTQSLSLMDNAHLDLLAIRQDAHWEPHSHEHEHDAEHEHEHEHDAEHEHEHEHDHDHTHSHNIDPHIWLNTYNAKQMVITLSEKLQSLDPKHKALYLINTKHLLNKLDTLHNKLNTELHTVGHKPFLVFHDAYQYFEKEFQLHASGSISLNPQVPLSAQRLNQLQTTMKQEAIQCVFSEPEFSQTIVQKLLLNTKVKNFELDPLGARIDMSNHNEDVVYFDLMEGLAHSFKQCLGG